MTLEIKLCKEFPLTLVALEPFDALMYLQVLQQVCFLGKGCSAALMSALERFLRSVDSDMVDKVLSFSEGFITVFIWTLHERDVSLTVRIFDSNDLKLHV